MNFDNVSILYCSSNEIMTVEFKNIVKFPIDFIKY